jgi:hypothetical protein
MAVSGGEFGDRRISVFIEAFPDGIMFAAECVEGHGDFGTVFPAIDNQVPVIAEAGDEVGIVGHPAVAQDVHFDQIHHAKNHQWLMGSDTKACRFRGIEVGEFAKPVGSEIRRHDEKVVVRKSMKFFSLLSIVDIHFEFDEPRRREGLKVL